LILLAAALPFAADIRAAILGASKSVKNEPRGNRRMSRQSGREQTERTEQILDLRGRNDIEQGLSY
jgi:hypothetical protein